MNWSPVHCTVFFEVAPGPIILVQLGILAAESDSREVLQSRRRADPKQAVAIVDEDMGFVKNLDPFVVCASPDTLERVALE